MKDIAVRRLLPLALIILASLALSFAPVWDTWTRIDPEYTAYGGIAYNLFGLLPFNDAIVYLSGAFRINDIGDLGAWNSRRPLSAVLMALWLKVSSFDIQIAIAVGAIWAGLCLAIAAREVWRILGFAPALLFVSAAAVFLSEWTATTLSEVNGFSLGMLAFAALLRAYHTRAASLFGLGTAALAAALMARSGPFLVLPAVLLGAIEWGSGNWSSCRRMLAAGLIGTAIGALLPLYLIWVFDGSAAYVQSNFSYTLYGMAMGGKGWMQAVIDHPDIANPWGGGETEIYRLAWDAIIQHPSGILLYYISELGRSIRFLIEFFRDPLLEFLFIAGVLTTLGVIKIPLGRFLLTGLAGVIASAPFLMADGGPRVFAAVVAWLAFVVAAGAAGIAWLASNLASGSSLTIDRIWPNWRIGREHLRMLGITGLHGKDAAGTSGVPLVSGLVGSMLGLPGVAIIAIFAAIAASPLIVKGKASDLVWARQAIRYCDQGTAYYVRRGNFINAIEVVSSSTVAKSSYPVFRDEVVQRVLKVKAPGLGAIVSEHRPPYRLALVYRTPLGSDSYEWAPGTPEAEQSRFPIVALIPSNIALRTDGGIVLCGRPGGYADPVSVPLGTLEVTQVIPVK